jgi:hypothetical protein
MNWLAGRMRGDACSCAVVEDKSPSTAPTTALQKNMVTTPNILCLKTILLLSTSPVLHAYSKLLVLSSIMPDVLT